jgi:hypothetical protein
MAKTSTRKKKTVRATRRKGAWDMVPTKDWHTAQYHIHYMMESKEWLNQVKNYIKKNYDKEVQVAINKLPDHKVGGKSHWATAAFIEENAPDKIHPDYVGKLDAWIKSLAEEGRQIVELKKIELTTKKVKYVPTIQERLQEATIDKMEELDQWEDDWIRDSKKNPLKDKQPLQLFRKLEVNLGHARFIQQFYEGAYQELEELINLPAPKKQDDMQQQLAEGFNHLSTKEKKELHGFYQRIFQALDILRAEKKQTRAVRKPKQKSAVDLVKKMKFKPSDPDYGISSIPPQDIVGAIALVVFNTKTRKLGIYYAEHEATLQVKGTTLQFFDEKTSRQKTVRKPSEILPQWKKVTHHKLKTQFGYLKTTDIKMNGRINEDTILLKAFK